MSTTLLQTELKSARLTRTPNFLKGESFLTRKELDTLSFLFSCKLLGSLLWAAALNYLSISLSRSEPPFSSFYVDNSKKWQQNEKAK
jgi:hypothetical protein